MIKPFEPYKVDQTFGNPTSYGPHEGWDMNGLGGGNTDCGTSLRAAGDGEIAHYSESTKDYGKLVVLYVKTTAGDRWVRYCHCQEVLVKNGLVKSGNVIALMGSTGNSTACHLHFDVLKKKPSNWRFFAKTLSELNEWFENPSEFFNHENAIISPVITDQTKIPQIVDSNGNPMEVQQIKSTLSDQKRDIENLRRDLTNLQDAIANQSKTISDLLAENQIQKQGLQEADTNRIKLEKEIEKLQEAVNNNEPVFSNPIAKILFDLAKRLG